MGHHFGPFLCHPETSRVGGFGLQEGSVVKKLYVGNLSYQVGDAELEGMFSPYGEVRSAQVVIDRDTGSSRGFGFVEMADDQGAASAIQALNNQDISGRQLVVNEARPRADRPAGSGQRGGYRRGG